MNKHEIEDLIAQNLTMKEIAEKMNTKVTNLQYWMKKYELQTLLGKHNYSCPTKEQLEDLVNQRLNLIEISRIIGYSTTSLSRYLVQYELKLLKKEFITKICPKCKVEINITDFQKRKDGRPRGYCPSCVSKEVKIRQTKKKLDAINYKGGKCEHCGYNKCIGALEFHHKNPEEKDSDWSNYTRFSNLTDEFKVELDKCLLLCSCCHRKEHQRIYYEYINQKFVDSLEGKVCKVCKIKKPLSDFENHTKPVDGKTGKCKVCLSILKKNRKENAKALLIKYKDSKCKLCNYSECLQALEFHHLDPTKKDFNISESYSKNIEELYSELDKCILLCANCHREVHSGIQVLA